MGDALRDRRSLKTLVASRQVIEIAEKISSFQRLAESVERDFSALGDGVPPPGWRDSPVRGRFFFDAAGTLSEFVTLSGRLEARVPVVCQRCLEPFDWSLETPVDLRFEIEGRAATDLRDDRETWELPDDTLQPIDVIDELLVMAMPLSTRHPDTADCRAREPRPAQEDTTRPFANLRTQMDDTKYK